MRITRIGIESFGKLKDRTFDLSSGLNVFYGPNESGKTTTMEFIRNILSPTRTRKYPERSKKDSGTIDYDDWGIQKKLSLDGREELPGCLSGMDPNLYRSIFAMDRAGLDQMESVTSSDIRSRFLTIPGGDTMPAAIEDIRAESERLMGKTNASQSRINAINRREESIQDEMRDLRSRAESYSQLSDEAIRLEASIGAIKERNRSSIENNMMFAKVESQRAVYNSLQNYRTREAELRDMKTVPNDAIGLHDQLQSDVKAKHSAFDAVNESRQELASRLPCNEKAVSDRRQEIESIVSFAHDYQTRKASVPVDSGKPPLAKLLMPLAMVAAIAVIFLIPGVDILYKGIGAAAIAAVLVLFLFATRSKKDPASAGKDRWMQTYEADVSRLSSELGMYPSDTMTAVSNMRGILSTLSSLDSTRQKWSDLQLESLKADNKLQGFLVQYGGEEGYQAAVANTRELQSVRSNIEALSSTIKKSGLDPDAPLPQVSKIDLDTSEQDGLSTDLGTVRQKMRQALDTERLDTLIDQTYVLKAERKSVLRQGAVAILADIIAEEACTEIYRDVHPGVVSTADRYLSLMTNGLYRLDLDPRKSDISVISGTESKGNKQWSSGLRAQVLLSLKLALAKEIGNGEVPIILDDVLLPFDSERKRGACEALESLGEEMQVLLFTCDEDIPEMVTESERTRIIAL